VKNSGLIQSGRCFFLIEISRWRAAGCPEDLGGNMGRRDEISSPVLHIHDELAAGRAVASSNEAFASKPDIASAESPLSQDPH
jgi:hypothetical protein